MHVGSTKRKAAVVRCAAANDDEDLGGLFSKDDVPARKSRPASTSRETAASGSGQAQRKKQKEFAWMDSDDEDEPDGPDDKQDDDKAEDKGDGSVNIDEILSVEKLDSVHSFGRMMLLEPAVKRDLKGGKPDPDIVASICRALGRTKFFDRDLLDHLNDALRRLLMDSKFSPTHTTDAVQCMHTLNAYCREVCSGIARSFTSRTVELEASIRHEWLETFKAMGHDKEPDFLQLLEVPPVPPLHPNYKKVRCFHFSRGSCALGVSCTFSHDPRAPLSLADGTKEDWWKMKGNIMMTQNQKCMGNGSYGTGRLGVNQK